MAEELADYTEDSIKSLDWKEHIRRRPGMYIGKLGDGSAMDDGIYILLKEALDNSIDEYMMGFGKVIDIQISEHSVSIRDHGRGIPLGKLLDVSSKINTGGKYDSGAFKKSVGLNGVGLKAVNALSTKFTIKSYREHEVKSIEFSRGEVVSENPVQSAPDEPNGVYVKFYPDDTIFSNFVYRMEYVEDMLRNYTYLNAGLTITLNGKKFISRNGLLDLLNENLTGEPIYTPIHLRGNDIEIALTHENRYGEMYYSFVNGQNTVQGGTHLNAFREAYAKTIKDFFSAKNLEVVDIRQSVIAAVSVRVEEPVFESQTKTKLGSKDMGPDGPSVQKFIGDFVKEQLDNFLHKNPLVAEALLKKIQSSEKERKAMAGVQKTAREMAKKANLHNKKLRDCRIHYNDEKHEMRHETSIFITEGDSASGSITKSRNPNTQAVFSLRGKPLNTFGLTKKVVYENEEFNLLQAALNIEDDLDNLRYNNVIIATDADVDGMHIRLLLITFFLQFFPELIHRGHVFILQTPLFRIRNKKETRYCYSEEERLRALEELKPSPEITRFKGLGEISPNEFTAFIGKDMRLEPVKASKDMSIEQLLTYYMGQNTPARQEFIIRNLRFEEDIAEE
ncbi:MAG: type IIA DNA topoisomerase subunit B [Bacteroidales bacterium]|jgi:topoisomerase-4 subunit B|nr:type IIA DNA topoisomerase subunit B [Bacteroidales bacterium]